MGTRVIVTDLDNHRQVIVRINDRGPYSDGRIIDLSKQAARQLHMLHDGVVPVTLRIVAKPDSDSN
jgi:rare lipoprotein A